ncbi:MAG: hypothetical protein J7M40_10100, partial [Planctomycetes bacterium]|nr:hypothetical protein [Planctomycetota bacterium]
MKSNRHPVKSALVILAIAMGVLVAGFAAKKAVKNRQYKKLNRDQVSKIAKGNPQAALEYAAKYLKDAPGDLESLYIRAVAYSSMNQPDTEYFYQLKIDGKTVAINPAPSFRTFPKRGTKSKFTIAFGGGAGYTPWHEYM